MPFGAMIYSHAAGAEISETIDSAKQIMARGIKVVRLQVAVPGQATYGAGRAAYVEQRQTSSARTLPENEVFDQNLTSGEPSPCLRRPAKSSIPMSNYCMTCMSVCHQE